MDETSRLILAIDKGDPQAAERLLLLVDALRELASRRLGREAPGQTLQATALVHEAYLRLVGGDPCRRWDGRAHFFAAAAEAMRRILVDRARDRRRLKRGGGLEGVDLDMGSVPVDAPGEDLIDLDLALTDLGREDSVFARLVSLRFFTGLTQTEAAEALGLAHGGPPTGMGLRAGLALRAPPPWRSPVVDRPRANPAGMPAAAGEPDGALIG